MQKNVRHCTQSVLLWIQDKHIFNISLLLFLKPITDMFYQFRFLDALLLAYAAGVLDVYKRQKYYSLITLYRCVWIRYL